MNVVNLTPHAINIVDGEGKTTREYPPSGQIARLASRIERDGCLDDGTPLSRQVFGQPEGLPDPAGDTAYIVSQLVVGAAPDRRDLYYPAELVRDSAGRVVGCGSLGR
jgi:hypothetical protein